MCNFSPIDQLIIQADHAWSQPGAVSGTYQMTADQAILTLELKVNEGSTLSGTLTSNTGIQYRLQGTTTESSASGTCSDGTSTVFFELYVEADDLVFSLIEPDGWNNPDYNTATYLSFTRKHASSTTENTAAMTTTPASVPPPAKTIDFSTYGLRLALSTSVLGRAPSRLRVRMN